MAWVMLRLAGQAALLLYLGVFLSACNKYGQGDRSLEAVVMIGSSWILLISFTIQFKAMMTNSVWGTFTNSSVVMLFLKTNLSIALIFTKPRSKSKHYIAIICSLFWV